MVLSIKPLLWSSSHPINPIQTTVDGYPHKSIASITPIGTSCLAVQYSSATDKTIDISSPPAAGIAPSSTEI